MASEPRLILPRLLPVLLVVGAAMAYIGDVQRPDSYVLRNTAPMIVLVALSAIALYRGGGNWTGAGRRWPLGTLGFAIPTLGLSLYLHHAYSVGLESLFGEARAPLELFRYLPIYTIVAGGIGFAIGWIVGRNI